MNFQVTIITCTYNAATVLERTLNSVRSQTLDAVEHIIIDGSSTDGTLDMIRAYAAKNTVHKVVVTSEKDNGLYDAMNKGVERATGSYIVFLNAGDTFYNENTLQSISQSTEAGREYGVIYGDTEITDETGHSLGLRRLRPPTELTWRSFENGMLVCHQAFYANTRIAKRVRYDLKYRFSADVDWCIRILKEVEHEGLTNHNTHKVLCRYLDGGMTEKNHRASLIERFRVMCCHYGLLKTTYKHITFLFR